MIRTSENIREYLERLNRYFENKSKKKWCDTCHCKDDCEDKDVFLKSCDDSCSWYS